MNMSGFILCKTKYADKPYCINNVAINIYSLEELCYYIYNNIYLVGEDLIEPGLIKFMEKELDEKSLADELRFLVEQKAGLSEIIMTILRSVDFYTDEEILALKKVIDQLDVQNVQERLKLRADNFLNNRRYRSALRNYELVIYGKRDEGLTLEFYGDVWHNMGVAYAGMFAFKTAADCFRKAYGLNRDRESLREYLAAISLSGEGKNGEAVQNLSESEMEMLYVARTEIESYLDHIPEEMSYMPVKEAFRLKDEGKLTEYHRAADELVEHWRKDYCNYMK